MKKIMTDRHKVVAMVLHDELGYTQTAIAGLMKVTQPTVYNAVKDARYMAKCHILEKELEMARQVAVRLATQILPQVNAMKQIG